MIYGGRGQGGGVAWGLIRLRTQDLVELLSTDFILALEFAIATF